MMSFFFIVKNNKVAIKYLAWIELPQQHQRFILACESYLHKQRYILFLKSFCLNVNLLSDYHFQVKKQRIHISWLKKGEKKRI